MARRKKKKPQGDEAVTPFKVKALRYFYGVVKGGGDYKRGLAFVSKEKRQELSRSGGIAKERKYGKNSVQTRNEGSSQGKPE